MLKDEILEILELFDKCKISEENQRKIFANGLNYDFTYGDPDTNHRNQHLNVFGVGMLLKVCIENHIRFNNRIINNPYSFGYENLVKEVAIAQNHSNTRVRRLGKK